MSLLRKASIVTTPTSYENGKILSIKPSIVLGEELITNGNFATDSDWSKGTGWSISGGKAISNGSQSTISDIEQNITLTQGSTYIVKFDLIRSAGTLYPKVGNTTGTGLTSTQSVSQNIVAGSSNKLELRADANFIGSITNVSVKEAIDGDFDFTRNSSATRVNSQGLIEDVQILSSNLVSNGDFSQEGSELVTNGDFATDSDWSKGTGWSISGGKGIVTNATAASIYQDVLTLSKSYKASFTISSIENGSLKIGIGVNFSQEFTEVGTYTYYGTPSNDSLLRITPSNGTNATIDNASVKEVGQGWTFLGDFQTDGTKAFITNASQYSQLTNQIGVNYLLSGNKYRLTFDIPTLSISGSLAYRYTGGSVTPILTTDIQNGKFTTDFIMPSNGYFWLQTTGSYTGLNVEVDNISVVEITDDTNLPRINYTNFDYEDGEVVPYSGEGSLLLEPQRTNLITYSEDFSEWSTIGTPTLNSNYGVSPDGTQNSTRVQMVSGDRIYIANAVVTDAAFSVYLKGSGVVRLRNSSNTLSNEVTLTSEWVRYYNVGDFLSTTNVQIQYVSGSVDFEIFGAQLEAGSYATSYIPTNGSTVTRLQDAAFGAGSSDLINSTEGVLYAEIASFISTDVTEPNRYLTLTNGTSNERIALLFGGNTNQLRAIAFSNTQSINLSFTTSLTDAKQFNKLAIKYKSGDYAFFLNGIKIGGSTETNIFTANTLNDLSFDVGGGTQKFRGKVKCVAVFKEALNNDELECLTGEGYETFNALALANNYTII